MRHIEGACHCGNIEFDFDLPDPGPRIPVRACGCTFCVKHGGVYTAHPDGRLSARIRDPGAVNRYRFGHGTADFYICQHCGVVPFVVSQVDGRDRAVVNVQTFTNVARDELDSSPTDFDAEDEASRLSRRARNWIGVVEIKTTGGAG